MSGDPSQDPWFASHAYIAMDGCVAVPEGRDLGVGDRVTLFEAEQAVATRKIAYFVDADSAKEIFDRLQFDGVYADKQLWSRIGAYWGTRAFERPFRLGHFDQDLPVGDSGLDSYPLVIEGMPPTAILIGGQRAPMGEAEIERLRIRLDSSARWEYRGKGTLRAGFRYRSPEGNEVLELHLGRPFYNDGHGEAPIDSIHILHLYLHGGKELASESEIRVSGQEEHVDLEPPQLDRGNWFVTSIETLGFISLDRGKTWLHLDRDTGFEGINWRVWGMSASSPLLWDYYLSTPH